MLLTRENVFGEIFEQFGPKYSKNHRDSAPLRGS